jgi:hypothetical protein
MHNLLLKEKNGLAMVAHPWKPIAWMKKNLPRAGTFGKYCNAALERGFTEISQKHPRRG